MVPGAAGVLLVAVCIRGPLKLQYAVIDLLAAPMAQLTYKQRIRPLRLKGASVAETSVLFSLSAIWILSWSYFLVRAITPRHAAANQRLERPVTPESDAP